MYKWMNFSIQRSYDWDLNSLSPNPFFFPPCLRISHSLIYTLAVRIITSRGEWICLYSHGVLGLKVGPGVGPASALSLARKKIVREEMPRDSYPATDKLLS